MIRIRYRFWFSAFALVGGLLGCATPGVQWDRELKDLRGQLVELRRSRTDHQARIQELQSRVFILEDRLETARLAAQRRNRRPVLPVVPLKPYDTRRMSAPLMVDSAPDSITVLREINSAQPAASPPSRSGGRVAGARGTGPPRTLAKSKLKRVSRRGIQTKERLSVASVPPPPSARSRTPVSPPAKSSPTPPKPAAVGRGAKWASAPMDRREAEPGDPLGRYQQAYDHMKAGQIQQAERQFRAFVVAHPDHDYADNALYWVGECYYSQKNFKAAVSEFRQVIETYPDGNKVPDALLKIGLSYLSLGDKQTATEVLGQVYEIFPNSAAAKVAKKRVKQL